MILYVMGAVAIVVGGLTAIGWLLSLTHRAGRLHRLAHVRPLTSPVARRQAWNKFGASAGLVLVGAVFLLTALGETPAWLVAVALGLLLIWDFGPALTSRLHRHPVA